MHIEVFLLLVGAGLALFGGALYMLHRSWGDFPTVVRIPPPLEPPAPRQSFVWSEPDADPAAATPAENDALGAAEPLVVGGLLPIEHPMLLQAARRALADNSPTAQYIIQDGDRLYLALNRISDPAQRYAAARMMRVLQHGDYLSILDTLRVLSRQGKG